MTLLLLCSNVSEATGFAGEKIMMSGVDTPYCYGFDLCILATDWLILFARDRKINDPTVENSRNMHEDINSSHRQQGETSPVVFGACQARDPSATTMYKQNQPLQIVSNKTL